MDGLGGYAGWRWYSPITVIRCSLSLTDSTRIFIIEGLLTTVVAVMSKWLVVDWPENAKFLDKDERAILLRRLADDPSYAKMDQLDKGALKRILGDWKLWIG